MLLQNLIDILNTFSKEEKKRFGRFILSEYYNTNKKISILYNLLLKQAPGTDIAKVKKEEIYEKLYEGEKFNIKTFSYLLSELLRLSWQFLLQRHLEKNAYEANKLIARECQERSLYWKTEKIIMNELDEIKKDSGRGIGFFQEASDLLSIMHANLILADKQLQKHPQRSSEYFAYYMISRLAYNCNNMLSMKINYNVDITSFPEYALLKNIKLKELLAFFERPENISILSEKEKIHVAMRIFLCFMITTLDIKDEEHFFELRALMEKYEVFNNYDRFNMYVMLESCCAMKRTAIDEMKYKKLYFEIKKEALEKGLHTLGPYMEVRGFRSIFHAALSLNEFEWAENFVNKHINSIAPAFRDEIFCFSNSELSFAKGNYEEALTHINKIDFKFEELKRFVKNLMFRIYYELGYIEQAYSLTDSYRHFIEKNKKISENAKLPNKNFLVFAKELLNLRVKYDRDTLEELEQKIISTNSVNSKNWLLEKIGELKRM